MLWLTYPHSLCLLLYPKMQPIAGKDHPRKIQGAPTDQLLRKSIFPHLQSKFLLTVCVARYFTYYNNNNVIAQENLLYRVFMTSMIYLQDAPDPTDISTIIIYIPHDWLIRFITFLHSYFNVTYFRIIDTATHNSLSHPRSLGRNCAFSTFSIRNVQQLTTRH